MKLQRLRWTTAGAIVSALLLASSAGANHQSQWGFGHLNDDPAETTTHCDDSIHNGLGCLYAVADGTDETALRGYSRVGSGIGVEGLGWIGVEGWTNLSATGTIGVSGRLALASPGIGTAGVKGATESTATNGNGPGVWGFHESSAGTSPGVLGTTQSAHLDAAGVRGTAPAGASGVRGLGGNGGWFSSVVANGTGVLGTVTGTGHGVRGEAAANGVGVRGVGGHGGHFTSVVADGQGVEGAVTGAGYGVNGSAGPGGLGVRGVTSDPGSTGYGVFGFHGGTGPAVHGETANGRGVSGRHTATTGAQPGVSGWTNSSGAQATGVLGEAAPTAAGPFSAGVRALNHGTNGQGAGIHSIHMSGGYGTISESQGGIGVYGIHNENTGSDPGVKGLTQSTTDLAAGVVGEALQGSLTAGVLGRSPAFGVLGMGGAAGVLGYNPAGLAGLFIGNVQVNGTLSKSAGSFRIDHPLEPRTKYLQHSFVESPDMKNVYDGVVRTDGRGYATVRLPRYFEALNRDFRYQLTPVGREAWDARAGIWQEIRANQFVIRSEPNTRISWQVTGIRKDAYANANRIDVEVDKADADGAAALRVGRRLR
jgi:hypothetical protein